MAIMRKLLSILTLLCLTVTGAWADDDSGSCGTSVTYSYEESTHTLTISGTGDMTDYSWTDYSPWYDYRKSITSIIIGYGVTHIGDHAFHGCGNESLTSIIIPESVITIGKNAFRLCTNLASVIIPASVTTIGNEAFYYCYGLTVLPIGSGVTTIGDDAFVACTGLTSVDIPDNVTTIGSRAFQVCSNLETVTIGKGLTSIGSYCFNGCDKLKSITVDSENPAFVSDESGVLFNKDMTTLIKYPTGNSRTSYIIPDGVTSIGNHSFYECALTSVTIPASVTSIDDYAFYMCSSLTEVAFPDAVTSIGNYSFYLCTGLTSVNIPTSVTSIGKYAFSGCTGLTSVTIAAHVTDMGDYAFRECSALTSVSIAEGATTISIGAFYDCGKITSVTIPASIRYIGDDAFYGCYKLPTVALNSNPYIGSSAFSIHTAVTMNLTGKEGEPDEYWMTFYNLIYDFEVPATGTQIFKAALNGSSLTLTEVETDKIIKSGVAVILKSTSGPITLTLSNKGSSNDFSGNSLRGVYNVEGWVGDGYTYVLNKGSQGIGFYKLAMGKKVGVGKAFLTYYGALAREYFGFNEATCIDAPTTEANDADAVVYDLQGRRVVNPAKGLYIVNGRKVFIRSTTQGDACQSKK